VLLYYAGYEGFHFLMHKPSMAWIENSPYFQFLKQHRRIHRVHMDRNLSVLLPLADWCLGTLVLDAPAVATTPESARRLARRHSEFGRRLREHDHSFAPAPAEERPQSEAAPEANSRGGS
jgi:hypothetical protein